MPRFTGRSNPAKGGTATPSTSLRVALLLAGLLVLLCGIPPAAEAQLNRSAGQGTERRAGAILTTAALGANGVFTGAWNDANIDGTTFVQAGVRADQASAANGLEIDETDDTTDANLTRVVVSATVGANTTTWISATIRGRNWRVKYTNGGTAQTSFKLTATPSDIAPLFVQGEISSGNAVQHIGCDNSVVYDASTSGSTQLVALVSGQAVYVCGFVLFSAGTANVKLNYGTGTACATGTTAMTPAFQLTAQTGVSYGNGEGTVTKTAAGNALCINSSAAVAVQAVVTYTQF